MFLNDSLVYFLFVQYDQVDYSCQFLTQPKKKSYGKGFVAVGAVELEALRIFGTRWKM